MKKKYENDDEIQIDLLEILYAFRHRLWMILLAVLLGGIGAGIYTRTMITPTYTSTSMMYVISKETTLTSLADLQIGSQLTNDYRVVITSRPVLQEVIDNLSLNMTYRQLDNMLTIENPADTRILSVTVTDPDPVRAKTIVDEVCRISSDYIGDIMEMIPPKIIEDGAVADSPSSPSLRRNVAMGGLLLGMLVCGIITLQVILNDTIRTEEDVEHYLGLSVLASIPWEETEKTEKSSGRRGKRSKHEKRKRGKKKEHGAADHHAGENTEG